MSTRGVGKRLPWVVRCFPTARSFARGLLAGACVARQSLLHLSFWKQAPSLPPRSFAYAAWFQVPEKSGPDEKGTQCFDVIRKGRRKVWGCTRNCKLLLPTNDERNVTAPRRGKASSGVGRRAQQRARRPACVRSLPATFGTMRFAARHTAGCAAASLAEPPTRPGCPNLALRFGLFAFFRTHLKNFSLSLRALQGRGNLIRCARL